MSNDDEKKLLSKQEIKDVFGKLSKIVAHLPKINTTVDPMSGMALIQKMQIAINQIAELLSGMRVLIEKTATGTLNKSELGETIQQFQALNHEIDRIIQDTNYGNSSLLDGSLETVTITDGNLQLMIQIKSVTTEALGLKSNEIDLYNIKDVQQTLYVLKNATEIVSSILNSLDENEIKLEKLMHNNKEEMDSMTEFMHAIETAQRARHLIQDASKLALLSHSITRDFVRDVLK